MGKIHNSPELIQKVSFLSRHSHKAYVSRSSISSEFISIHQENLCDETFCISSKDLLDLLKNTQEFNIEGQVLVYAYDTVLGGNMARVVKKVPVFDSKFVFDFQNPLLTARISNFKCLSSEPTSVKFSENKLVLETRTYIKTRMVIEASKVDGIDTFEIEVSGKKLKIIEELENELVLCFYRDCIVVFQFQNTVNTAVIIN